MSDSENSLKDERDEEEITKDVEKKCWDVFLAFDEEDTGQIQSSHLRDMVNMLDLKMSNDEIFKMISEIDPENTGFIMYCEFKNKIVDREVSRLKGSDEAELLDAFVAMGGQPDGEGCVDATKLIDTIKNEFQMTIDIERLIEEIDEDGSGEIEFDEFKALLQ